MLYLDLVTILSAGLLIGTEACVSLFINPILWSLDERTQVKGVRMFAARLGKAMPFWYAASLILLVFEAVVRRHEAAVLLLVAAAMLWTFVILATILFLVPINNRLIREAETLPFADMKRQHTRWDLLHRLRVLTLIVSMVCFLVAIQA
ncbi:anthrone oxygenase family protein [Silvibacterium acidisoli]|uniref:anthrone oxygenase family protein n=1 Tax=Acidobacteriaceae bacterium ZG23-2 TaxID=2883246 RepID=UPI00406CBC57